MTQRMGFTPQRDEYLIAQHAKAGNAGRFMNVMLEEIIDIETRPIVKLKKNLHRGCLDWRPEIKTVQDIADLAATTQKVFEACVHVLSDYTKNETKSDNIALAGGGALNKLAVDGIRRDWKNVHVPQNPGDPGSCIGAVLAKSKQKIVLDKQWYQKV
jgi:predicted NodU family carbamoyl transferase